MGSKLLAGKAASSPLSVANRVPEAPAETQNRAIAGQQLKPETCRQRRSTVHFDRLERAPGGVVGVCKARRTR